MQNIIGPWLASLTRSELFVLMTAGMTTIAGTVLVLYASLLRPVLPDALGHILTASLISAPAALVISFLMVPHLGETTTGRIEPPVTAHSAMDAIVQGTLEGVKLLLNITAMLIVFIALVSLVNACLGVLPEVSQSPITLQRLLGGIQGVARDLTFVPLAGYLGSPSLLVEGLEIAGP